LSSVSAPARPRGCLVVIFNHYYPGNVEKLERLYAGRFSHMLFLVPNVRLDRADCVTVYRGSFTFQGYIADARERLAAIDADYFVFTADDLILNPADSETTLYDRLGLRDAQGFLPDPRAFAGDVRRWDWWKRVAWRLRRTRDQLMGSGVEKAFDHLPPRELAEARFAAMGYADPRVRILSETGRYIMFNPPRPLLRGVSDMFALRREALPDFAHCCGVFASLDLFVEVALPTAMMLACDRLATLKTTGLRMNWAYTPLGPRRRRFKPRSLEPALAEFTPDLLFVHPVKLSQVDLENIVLP